MVLHLRNKHLNPVAFIEIFSFPNIKWLIKLSGRTCACEVMNDNPYSNLNIFTY